MADRLRLCDAPADCALSPEPSVSTTDMLNSPPYSLRIELFGYPYSVRTAALNMSVWVLTTASPPSAVDSVVAYSEAMNPAYNDNGEGCELVASAFTITDTVTVAR